MSLRPIRDIVQQPPRLLSRGGSREEDGMNAQLRHLVVLAAMAATPALGQIAAPTLSLPSPAPLPNPPLQAGEGRGGEGGRKGGGAASIPDFSGVWAKPPWPNFQPTRSGPRPV